MNHGKKKTLLLQTLLVLVLAGCYLLTDCRMRVSEKELEESVREEKEALTLLSLDESMIRSISFVNREEGGEITFTAGNGIWICPDDPDFVMDEEKIRKLTGDLEQLTATRRLDETDDLSAFGLAPARGVITIRDADGDETVLLTGVRNDATGELYIQTGGDEETVYLTKASLDRDFCGTLKDFAAYEEVPALEPSRIRRIDVLRRSDGYTLDTPGDASCTVTGTDGITEPADLSEVGLAQNRLGNLNWLSDLEYRSGNEKAYGLDDPSSILTVTQEGGDTVTIRIGETDADGNYYVQLEGSSQVHSVRREYLEGLLEGNASDFRSLSYSFVSLGDLDTLYVTYKGKTYTLRARSSDESFSEESMRWYVNGAQVEKEPFTGFYYACVSVTAQKRLSEIPKTDEAEMILGLEYALKDAGKKEIRYFPADRDFCLVTYDGGSKAALVNRMYVREMTEKLEELIGDL